MPRRDKHTSHDQENHDRWLVSYADFMTLLFAFFVVMYSISSVNEGKYKVLSETLIGAFAVEEKKQDSSSELIELSDHSKNSIIDFDGRVNKDGDVKAETDGDGDNIGTLLSALSDQVESAFGDLVKDGEITISGSETWIEISLSSGLLFNSGSATLNPRSFPVLEEISGVLSSYENPVHVEGFTDDLPIQSGIFPSNWELSAARSAAVVRLLAENGLDPYRLAAVGYGQFQPIATNDSAEGRGKNRRVALIVSRDLDVRRALTGVGEAIEASEQNEESGATPFLKEKDRVKAVELEGGGLLFTQDDE
jgi:chemotaxis protein MotB